MEDNYIMIKKRLFKFTSVFMCAAMMAVSFAACGTNTASVNDTNSVAYEQSKSGEHIGKYHKRPASWSI